MLGRRYSRRMLRSMLGNRSWDSWIAQYSESHRHPLNRTAHMFGIPMILSSLSMMLAGILWRSLLWGWVGMFVAGWALQFLGHWVEGKAPEFLSDWRFLLVGSRWWLAKMASAVRAAPTVRVAPAVRADAALPPRPVGAETRPED